MASTDSTRGLAHGAKDDIRLLEALDELGAIARGGRNFGEIAARAVEVIKASLRLAYVGIARVDVEANRAEHVADASELGQRLSPGYSLPLTRGIVGRCARTGKTVHVEDVAGDPDYVETLPGIRTVLAVPVRSADRLVAVLVCEARIPGALEDRVLLLEVVANRLGVALDNAELFLQREAALGHAERQAAHFEALSALGRIATEDLDLRAMLQRTTDELARRFGWEFVACVSIDWAANRFRCEALSTKLPTDVHVGYGRPLGSGVVGRVALTRRGVVIDDVTSHADYVETLPGARSEICVPVISRGTVVALINAESTRPGAFRDQLPLLEAVAEQVAGAVASAQMHGEVQRRARELQLLTDVSRTAFEKADDFDLVLTELVAYVQRELDLCLVAVLLFDDQGVNLELAAYATSVPVSVTRGMRVSPRLGVIGRAIRTGEPALVLDVGRDPDYVAVSEAVVAELVVPIWFRNRVLGVVDLNSTTGESFSPESVMVLRLLVEQVAGALRMAAMNRRLTEANRVLTELFSRYVAPDLAEILLTDPERFQSRGERREASVLFADIRGFTHLSQRLSSEDILALLNEYYSTMGEAIFRHRGSVNKIIGDGLMAVFGVPERLEDHATAAVLAARDMQAAATALGPRWERLAGSALQVVVAVNSGEVIAGSIGDPRHMEFTVLGDVVNVSARLEAEAKSREAGILITEAVRVGLSQPIETVPLGSIELRGRTGAVPIHRVVH